MPLNALQHYAIRTTRLRETRDFYVDILGLHDGERPPFDFPGNWLYLGDHAVVHLLGIDSKDSSGLAKYLGDKTSNELAGTGAVDHIAFGATDIAGLRARIERHGIKFFERKVPGLGLRQLFLEDPNGIKIELNFPATESSKRERTVATGAA